MKIVYFSEYSWPNIDGVWNRVYNEASYFIKKGNEVHVFSNNILLPDKTLPEKEEHKKIKISRFSVRRITKNASFWPKKQVLNQLKEINPSIIICNNRHPEVKIALKYSESCNIPCILVTHAPFLERGIRPFWLEFLVKIYDKLLDYNKFDKVIAISHWEKPFLIKLGCKEDKIVYIPNSIPELFYKTKTKQGQGILFLGRISPIKSIETLIKAMKNISFNLDIVGSSEPSYLEKLKYVVEKLELKNINFLPAVYELNKKIALIDKHEIFVLPSKREGMPQSLIEAMARGKIVVSSKNQGAKEIIADGKNGFLFDIGSESQLLDILGKISKMTEKEKEKIRKEAVKTAEQYKNSLVMKETEKLYKELIKKREQ